MVELRWLTKKTGEQVLNKYGFFQNGEVTVLQYRQKIDTTIRAGMWSNEDMLKTANYQWSDWVDVPTVIETMTPTNKCQQCGIEMNGNMGYVCNQLNCPTGLGGSIS